MSERKVLNKFYPNDFDPSKLPPLKSRDEQQCGVRMMLPMTIRCNSCGQALYVGTKFNMRKEICSDEYLGIKMYRFYMKCTKCYQEITMKTDPRSSDYICEFGATRNYEPWRDIISAVAAYKEQKLDEEEGNVMKSLENKSYDSKKEMDVLDALNEVRLMNKRLANVDHEGMLSMVGKQLEEDTEIKQKLKTLQERRVDLLITNEEAINTTNEEAYGIMRPTIKKSIRRAIKITKNDSSNKKSKIIEPKISEPTAKTKVEEKAKVASKITTEPGKAESANAESIIGSYSSSDDE